VPIYASSHADGIAMMIVDDKLIGLFERAPPRLCLVEHHEVAQYTITVHSNI